MPPGRVRLLSAIPPWAEVFADSMIHTVFSNLVDNAARHGGGITTIRFSVQDAGDATVLAFEDDGAGVRPELKERIFDRGFGGNTGFGLFLSREILAITDMTIRETGTPGSGARFEITMPASVYRGPPPPGAGGGPGGYGGAADPSR